MVNRLYPYFPLILFSIVWGAVIYLTMAGWYNINSISNDTWFILLIGLYAFAAGYFLFALYDPAFLNMSFEIKPIHINEYKISATILLFFLISSLGSILIIKTLGEYAGDGVSTYWTKPINIRRAYVEIQSNPLVPAPLFFKVGSYLVNFSFIGNLLGGIILTSSNKLKWFGLLPILATLFYSISIFGRFSLITGLAFYFISYLVIAFFKPADLRRKLFIKLIVAVLVVGFAIYYLFYYIVLARYSLDLDLQEYFNKTLYFYFSGGVSAFDNFIHTDFNHTYGTSSFRSVIKWLARLGVWPEEDVTSIYDPFTKVSPTISINTYTYIRSLYMDFGISGVIWVSFLWGSGVKYMLKKVLQDFSAMKLFVFTILLFGSLMTFYSFYFESLTAIIFWMLPLILFRQHFQKCFFSH